MFGGGGEPCRPVVDGRAVRDGGVAAGGETGRRRVVKSDGEGSVEFAGEKGMGGSIDEAVNRMDERPA